MQKPRIIDFFDYMRNYIGVNKVKVDDCLLINYQCWETGQDKVWFKESHFVFILTGEKKWELNGEIFEAKSGEVVFVKQGGGIIHHSSSSEFCALILFVPHTFVGKFLVSNTVNLKIDKEKDQIKPLVKLDSNIIIEGYRNSLLSYLTDSTIDQVPIARTKLNEFLQYIFTQSEFHGIAAYLKSLTKQDGDQIQFIMEGSFMLPLGLEQFASMCNMSLSKFKRKFNDVYHVAPGVWLIEQRLTLSKKLLESSEMSVSEVADACGFNSSSYFVKAFKKQLNQTPLQFRKS